MALYKNINSIKMKTVGAVVFIRLLLLIAGVEPNPGPPDVLVFRYQYLLIEVGTILLRKLFDAKVGYDLMLYLRTYRKAAKQLMALLGNDIITAEQKKLLPPLDNNPNTANFDITLLFCLLRNICGLKPQTDAVWKCPASSDTSVEAEITRLKEFRNFVVHRGTVYISESDFNQKWSELCQILHKLNNFCGIPNLTEMIEDARSQPLDDQIKQLHDNILQAWHEAERLFEKGILDIKQTQSELMEGQSEIKLTQSELMDGQSEIKLTQSELMGGQFEIKQTQSQIISGQSKIKQTQSELIGGQSKIKQTQSELMGGQSEIKQTQSELMGGQSEIKQTQSELMGVQSEIKQTQSDLMCGQSEIKQTQSELMGGQFEIKQTQSELVGGQSEIKQTQSELMGGQSEIKQTQFEMKVSLNEIPKLLKNVQVLQEQTKRRLDNSEQHDRSNKRIKSCTYDDIQQQLIKIYQKDICSGLPLCPLLEDETESILRLYELPTMYVVNYHRVEKQKTDKSSDNLAKVKMITCSDLFHVKDKDCKNIYLTGDAGVGKTSFSKFLSLLWCKSKLGMTLEKVDMQRYIDYLARFDFVFYVNLRDTDFTDLIAIIVDQLFYSENKDKSNKMYDIVEEILGNHHSLVIMDGLDEWIPKLTSKRKYELPVRPKSECVYLTTCRPYKIENIRLSETNLDNQVKMTGLGKKEIKSYVSNLIDIINTKYDENKNKNDFMMAVKASNLFYLLHIPMITSHLVMLWFDRPLSTMSKSLIYGNIMDMLFKLALKKEIAIPLSKPSKLKFPDRLSELEHFKDHFSHVEQLCLLSFKLLFENTDITSLVFSRDQLASEPFCLSEVDINFFCTIGILSKNTVKRKFGKQEHKLSFLHKSYLEFFAAIYASTLEISNVLELFHQCRTINDVLKYENFLIFYAGLSAENLVSLMTRIYSLISKHLYLSRVLSIFSLHETTCDKSNQLLSLQDLILNCYIDGSYPMANLLPLEDFIYHTENTTDTKTKYLRKLMLSNLVNVRQLRLETGEYFDEFDKIFSLQALYISTKSNYDSAFNELMKQNKSSLQIINISCGCPEMLLHSLLPLEDLHYLTSLSLAGIKMSHQNIEYFAKFLSNNSQLKHVRLGQIRCTDDVRLYNDVCSSFELAQCNKLEYLKIDRTNIVCTNINTTSLEFIGLQILSKSIARSYINIFNSIQSALELKYLDIDGMKLLDDYLVETLITNVRYLSKIESIILWCITIRDNVSFLLHPSVKQVSIKLSHVNMTGRCLQTFIGSFIDKNCCIKLCLHHCIIRQDNKDTKVGMSMKESGDYIFNYIKSISAIKILNRHNFDWFCLVINDNQ